jgi:site-specific DNA recombinase
MTETVLNQTLATYVTGAKRRKRAALYLRVSTPGQVNTDYNPEGISIPAQREAGQYKANLLDADIVREFVEPGRTATSIDKRPVFQEMLAWVKEQKDIDYVIVYHFNRVFRNSVDAAITKRDLQKFGTRIVSTVLDMGEGPESAMVESIIHAVDQYQSQASGADIRYKMGQKVKNGGTIGPAKLGYLNVREAKPEGGEIRTIAVDEERGPLVVKGIELFATGQHTARQALDQISAAGLRTRPTRARKAKPLSLSQFYEILTDRYYCGYVTHDDQEYPGRHDALISEELYERVQRVLALRGGGGTRQRHHSHWLKGLLWCHRCGYRMVITRGKGNGGVYFYFFCRGRQKHLCDLPFLGMAKVEAAVERHLATVRLSGDFRAHLVGQLNSAMLYEQSGLNDLKKRLSARLSELDVKEDGFLDLVDDPDWPREKIKKKLAGIETERAEIAAQLADTTSKLDTGRQFFILALELLSDPQGFYQRGNAAVKKVLVKIIFGKLKLDAFDPEGQEQEVTVGSHELTEGFDALVETGSLSSSRYSITVTPTTVPVDSKQGPIPKDGALLNLSTEADLLAAVLSDQGSNRAAVVEVLGAYANRSDQLEQVRELAPVTAEGRRRHLTQPPTRREPRRHPRKLRDRFSPDQLRAMVDEFAAGATGKQVADRYGISVRTLKRLLREQGVRRER